MIVKIFDPGWGPQLYLKSLESQILTEFLRTYHDNDVRTVMINNTWYTDDFHERTMRELSVIDPDLIFLVSMFDPPAPRPDLYPGPKTIGIGYYPGVGEIDFWALAVEKHMMTPTITDIPDMPFMCLNRKPHWHRVKLYDQISYAGVLDRGMVSLGGSTGSARRTLPDDRGGSDMAPNPGADQHGIVNDIFSLGNPANWNRCLINIVTETMYDITQTNFVSEKIYKPIVGQRPFLVYAPDGGRGWVESRGFQTYLDDWHDITDLDLADPENIVPFLTCLCEQPQTYLRKKIIDLAPKISYNKQRFHAYCQEQHNIIKKGLPCPV